MAISPDAISQPSMPAAPLVPDGDEWLRATLAQTWHRRPGLKGWISTTNHKDIGMRFIVTAFVFLLLGGILALMLRMQLMRPDNTLMGPQLYNQLFTTHGTTMMFLFAVPIMEGFGLYLVPLMLGTRNVSFPRLLNFGYYVYLFAGLALYGGLLLKIWPDQGWFSYTPLSGPEFSPGKRVDLWSQVVTLVEISTLVGAAEIIATVFKQRAPGMSLSRIPLFVWAQLVTAFMIIFAMPAVMLSSTMLTLDRLPHVNTHFFNHAEGGDSLLWQHLFWFFAHPEVYIIFIPATGFISAILPAFTRRKMFGYLPLVLSMIATAFIGFGVWVHHMFATPLPELGQGLFTASSMMITIPNGIQIFCWTATLWGGRIYLKTPILFILGFFTIFVIGGLTGVMLASLSLNLQAHDTMFVVAHLHYVLIGGAVFPLFGAFYFWFPKWTGRMLNEVVGWWNFGLMFIGFNLAFFPLHQLGLQGMPRRVYSYQPDTGWANMNLLATAGAFLIALGVLVFMINVFWSRRHGLIAGDNPWGADTLEWATSSPPPPYNFAYLPTVTGRAPVWEDTPETPVVRGLSATEREVLITTTHDAIPDHRYHMSKDSLWSFSTAVVTACTLMGVVFHPIAIPIGAVFVLAVLVGWFHPTNETKPIHNPQEQPDPESNHLMRPAEHG
jgi:cytochrome c oxidase subunit I+III